MSLYLGENLISGAVLETDTSRNIGQIITSTLPLSDAGLHLLDGALIDGSGSYAKFVDYIANLYGDGTDVPSYFCTEANWQTAVMTYGVCGKFVYDSANNTVRLPKITGIIEGTTDVAALCDLVQAGLPNITGGSTMPILSGMSPTGALYRGNSVTGQGWYNTDTNSELKLDASRSSSIYGNSNTVQPQTIKVLYYIVLATSTKTAIEVDIDEIATDLAGKADVDLSNCTKPHIVETYVNGQSGYRLWSDKYCEQWGYVFNSQTVNLLKTFANTDYNISLGAFSVWTQYITDKYTSSFAVNAGALSGNNWIYYPSYGTIGIYWKASGYLA